MDSKGLTYTPTTEKGHITYTESGLMRAPSNNMNMSNLYKSLSHSTYDCKYHIVFIPKCRKKAIYGAVRQHLGTIFHELARQKEATIIEGHMMLDHVHILMEIPPKHAVASMIGFMKGKSAIAIARPRGKERNFQGENFWARGYAVSTVGLEEAKIRQYIHDQEEQDDDKGRF